VSSRCTTFTSPLAGEDILTVPEAASKLMEMLDDSAWAKDLALDDVKSLAAHLTLRCYPPGAVVFQEGDADERYLAIILKGAVEIVKSELHEGVDSRFVIKMGPGRAFGEMALIEGAPRSATAVATPGDSDETWLLILTEEGLEDICARDGKLGLKLLRNIARLLSFRLRHTSERLLNAI